MYQTLNIDIILTFDSMFLSFLQISSALPQLISVSCQTRQFLNLSLMIVRRVTAPIYQFFTVQYQFFTVFRIQFISLFLARHRLNAVHFYPGSEAAGEPVVCFVNKPNNNNNNNGGKLRHLFHDSVSFEVRQQTKTTTTIMAASYGTIIDNVPFTLDGIQHAACFI